MQGKITIELRAKRSRETGSDLPDLGHDAYWLKKAIPDLTYTAPDGQEIRIADKYEITRVGTRIEEEDRDSSA